ncbi:MAG: cyclopropane-fatty-acyl-phospholipid synthase family protein [Litoreibacter sp.]
MWTALFAKMVNTLVKTGALKLHMADGTVIVAGDMAEPKVTVQIHDADLPRKFILNPELALGEAYMDCGFTIVDDDLHGLLTLLIRNNNQGNQVWWQRAAYTARHFKRGFDQHNPLCTSRQNVEHHYDLSEDFYDLFMEQDKQYTCAYFKHGDETLEQAQSNKKSHIASKLLLKPGMRVLDIGSGWGGLAITMAQDYGVNVVGLTLSELQRQSAIKRAEAAGVADKVEFRLCDYRHLSEKFDRITAVGMMEHVGQPQFRTFFRQINANLRDDGVALIHFIGRSSPPDTLSPWFQKYIFPGGYAPAMSEVIRAVEQEKLVACDVEVWRGHYERTLQIWQQRFQDNHDTVLELHDERFIRMWRYYLVASELSFSEMTQVLFQLQLSKQQLAVPSTRDYLYK